MRYRTRQTGRIIITLIIDGHVPIGSVVLIPYRCHKAVNLSRIVNFFNYLNTLIVDSLAVNQLINGHMQRFVGT